MVAFHADVLASLFPSLSLLLNRFRVFAVELLMQNFEEQFNVSYFADLKCSHELLTPLEMGLIAAAQVPKLASNQVLAQKLDPYTRMYLIFECGAVPRI